MTEAHFPVRRLAFRVEYEGTDYHGWQAQPDTPLTIQAELERAVMGFLGLTVRVDGASRTDSGVHALDQLAACTIKHPVSESGFAKGVNRRLPAGIAIREVSEVPADFVPRFANAGKTYCYRIYSSHLRRPLIDRYAWRIPWQLDLEAMRLGAAALIGEHDFSSFAASDGSHKSAVRTLDAIVIEHEDTELVTLRFTGRAFLKQMVRNLVGTLVDVGRGHREAQGVEGILLAQQRQAAGPTAPACGLTLEKMWMRTESRSKS